MLARPRSFSHSKTSSSASGEYLHSHTKKAAIITPTATLPADMARLCRRVVATPTSHNVRENPLVFPRASRCAREIQNEIQWAWFRSTYAHGDLPRR